MGVVADPVEPSVSLTRALSIGALLEQAAKEIPQLDDDGLVVSVHVDERGASVAGTVQVKDFFGTVVARKTWDGQKEISGQIRWTF